MAEIVVNNLREHVETVCDFMAKSARGSDLIYRFYLDHGRDYQSVPWETWEGAYDRGEPKQCFANAENLAVFHDELTYVEGLATRLGAIPIPHAWCVDADGRVVEPTWLPDPECDSIPPVGQWEYLGVPFKTDWLVNWTLDQGYYGIFGNCFAPETLDEIVKGIAT